MIANIVLIFAKIISYCFVKSCMFDVLNCFSGKCFNIVL
jgi:hypothetical protein